MAAWGQDGSMGMRLQHGDDIVMWGQVGNIWTTKRGDKMVEEGQGSSMGWWHGWEGSVDSSTQWEHGQDGSKQMVVFLCSNLV